MSLTYLVGAGHMCGGGGHCPTGVSWTYLFGAVHLGVWGGGGRVLSCMGVIDLSRWGRTLAWGALSYMGDIDLSRWGGTLAWGALSYMSAIDLSRWVGTLVWGEGVSLTSDLGMAGWHCPTWVSLTYLGGAGHLHGGHCPTWVTLTYLGGAGHLHGGGAVLHGCH